MSAIKAIMKRKMASFSLVGTGTIAFFSVCTYKNMSKKTAMSDSTANNFIDAPLP